MKRSAVVRDGQLQLRFEIDPVLLDFVRHLPDREWNPKVQAWCFPATRWHVCTIVPQLEQFGFEIDKSVQPVLQPDISVRHQLEGLYPYQRAAVLFIQSTEGRALLADDMGLGKTITTFGWMYANAKKLSHTFVFCPVNVLYKWRAEAAKWLDLPTQVVEHTKQPLLDDVPITVMSYDMMKRKQDEINALTIDQDGILFVFDEVHYLLHHETQRSKVASQLVNSADYVLGLSGTPFVNKPVELFGPLHIVDPRMFPNWYRFAIRYTQGPQAGWQGVRNVGELKNRLSTVMIRRTKREVKPEMPPVTWSFLPMAIDNMKQYREAENDVIAYLERVGKDATGARYAETLVRMNVLRQIAGMGKVANSLEWAESFLTRDDEDKLVMYAHHLPIVRALANGLQSFGVETITGEVSAKKRDERWHRFQDGPSPRVMVINQAGGEGIDLFRACNIFFVEREYVPRHEDQAIGRLDRIGQTRPVNVWMALGLGTIDRPMSEIVEKKRKMFGQVLKVDQVEKSVLSELVHSLVEGK